MKTRIPLNQHSIKHNQKHSTRKPILTCKTNIDAHERTLDGPGRIIDRSDKSLTYGAHICTVPARRVTITA